jgi:hypothetical protein
MDGAGLRGLVEYTVNSGSGQFVYCVSLQEKPRFVRKEYQLHIDQTFDDIL